MKNNYLISFNEKLKSAQSRRRNFRSPFPERRKRNAIEVFRYEINKLCIVSSIKKRMTVAFSDFVKGLKTSPRNFKQEEIAAYLNSLPANKQSATASLTKSSVQTEFNRSKKLQEFVIQQFRIV